MENLNTLINKSMELKEEKKELLTLDNYILLPNVENPENYKSIGKKIIFNYDSIGILQEFKVLDTLETIYINNNEYSNNKIDVFNSLISKLLDNMEVYFYFNEQKETIKIIENNIFLNIEQLYRLDTYKKIKRFASLLIRKEEFKKFVSNYFHEFELNLNYNPNKGNDCYYKFSEFIYEHMINEKEEKKHMEQKKEKEIEKIFENTLLKKQKEIRTMEQLNFLNTVDTMSNNDEKLKIESGYVKENRGKTAIKRKEISKPLKELLKRGSLEGNKTILDNGCGFGIDFNYLKQLNYEAYGFDKFQEKFNQNDFLLNNTYDVVLSTFVINTIDDKKEIEEYIKQAFEMTNKKLIISVRMDKKAVKENWIKLEDGGYITSLKTYQKFYTKETIKELIENTLHIKLNKENCLQFGETTIINKECL